MERPELVGQGPVRRHRGGCGKVGDGGPSLQAALAFLKPFVAVLWSSRTACMTSELFGTNFVLDEVWSLAELPENSVTMVP